MLIETIQSKSLAARKAGRQVEASLLVTLYSEASMAGKNAGNRESTDAEVIAVVNRFLKGVNDSIRVITDESRRGVLMEEKAILEQFLPAQMTQVELSTAIDAIVNELNLARNGKSMGVLMKELKARFEGRYDGALASQLVKAALA